MALIFKILGKNDLLTTFLEDIYFMNISLNSLKHQDSLKILRNLFIHYCIYDINRVFKKHFFF